VTIAHGGNLFGIAREQGWDWREVLDFSASVNPLGPAPGVREAIIDALDEIVHYPEPHAGRLATALGDAWNVDPDRILNGNGASELIHFVARVWPVAETTLVVPTFSEFHRAYPNASWAPAESPDSWPDDGLLILTRPNNPLGTDVYVPGGRTGPLLVDESFLDFTDLETSINDADIVLRSLTKTHAIPGLRAGALIGPAELVRKWREQRDPWQLNVLAEAAVLASIRDPAHRKSARDYVTRERARLWPLLREVKGIKPVQGCANFYFVKLEYPAADLCAHFLEHKMIVRNCTGWIGIEGEAVRFAIRTHEENDRLMRLWREFQCDC
jgi:threonine-phosphate decarboxylase